MSEKCFCHLNGYAVKDATARLEAMRSETGVITTNKIIQDMYSEITEISFKNALESQEYMPPPNTIIMILTDKNNMIVRPIEPTEKAIEFTLDSTLEPNKFYKFPFNDGSTYYFFTCDIFIMPVSYMGALYTAVNKVRTTTVQKGTTSIYSEDDSKEVIDLDISNYQENYLYKLCIDRGNGTEQVSCDFDVSLIDASTVIPIPTNSALLEAIYIQKIENYNYRILVPRSSPNGSKYRIYRIG